jgi:molybdopterin/thiamine biosynthesis adenylyltransferase
MIRTKSLKASSIYIPYHILLETLDHFMLHGQNGNECIVYWCGKLIDNDKAVVTSCIYPTQYATALGVKVEPSEVARIYLKLYEAREHLLAQLHSHPSAAFHSSVDDYYPVVHKPGLLSIVVPEYGLIDPRSFLTRSAVYEYQAQRVWRKLTLREVRARLKVLPKDFEERLFSRTKLFASHLGIPVNNLLFKLKMGKIAVAIDDELLHSYRGQCMLVACINLLARCSINIDVFLPRENVNSIHTLPLIEGDLASGLAKLCIRINPNCMFRLNPSSQGYDAALIIGEEVPIKAEQRIFIDALGWLSYMSTKKGKCFSGDAQNPIGPLVASCFGSAEIVKALFNKIVKSKFKPIETLTFSALNYKINHAPWNNPSLPNKVSLDACLIGAGAIGMAVAYTLASLPAVSGKLVVIDPEIVEISNLNRYSLATITDVGLPKVDVVKRNLKNLEVKAFKGAYEQYPQRGKHDVVVVAVDNVKTRREVQLDFPRIILNGGMYANSFRISRHDDFLNKACLGCLYPSYSEVSSGQPYPAVSFTSMFAGALLVGEVLKEQVVKLREYRLNNAFIVNDVFATPKIGETYLMVMLEKSDDCSCRCRSQEVIEAYKKLRLGV